MRTLAHRERAVLTLSLLALAVGAACGLPFPRTALTPRDGPALAAARSWGYQLQNVVAQKIPDGFDVVVVDYSRDGTESRAFTADMVAALKRRNSTSRRLVLCYLSVGEAESYRYYWKKRWEAAPPAWLGLENKEWKGNFAVHFWDPAWQRLLLAPAPTLLSRFLERVGLADEPYIDRILEAGFDGVLLDKVDSYADMAASRATAEHDMIDLVARLAAYARLRRPGFLIVPQNGEELLRDAGYRGRIDGVAKEDLLYGVGGDEIANPTGSVEWSEALLDKVKADQRPVFIVEYLADPTKRAAAAQDLRARGYVPFFGKRDLGVPPVLVPKSMEASPKAGE